jgi:hypothetical protein
MDKQTIIDLATSKGHTMMSLAGDVTTIHGLPYLVVKLVGQDAQVWKFESYIDASREQRTAWYSNLADYVEVAPMWTLPARVPVS